MKNLNKLIENINSPFGKYNGNEVNYILQALDSESEEIKKDFMGSEI